MTTKFIFRILTTSLIVLYGLSDVVAQSAKKVYWQTGAGITLQSFFGDLSVHDFNPLKKISNESDLGFYVQFTGNFTPLLSTKAQFIHGKMRGSNPESGYYFNAGFNELTIIPRLNINSLFLHQQSSRFQAFIVGGVGLINFRSTKYNIADGSLESSVGYNEKGKKQHNPVYSFVFPLGIEATYAINARWGIEAGYTMRLHNTDNIDAHIGSTNINDRYSVTHLGIIYTLNGSPGRNIEALDCSPGDGVSRIKKKGRLF